MAVDVQCKSGVKNEWFKACNKSLFIIIALFLIFSKICLLMVGLDNAGKTTAVKAVQRENVEEVAPTVGFSSVEIRTGILWLNVIDLNGHVDPCFFHFCKTG